MPTRKTASDIGIYGNAKKTELICHSQDNSGSNKSLKNENIKAAQEKKLLGSNTSAKSDADIRLSKVCTPRNNLKMIYKSPLTSKPKVIRLLSRKSVLVYEAPLWTLTKSYYRITDDAYAKMPRAALNISRSNTLMKK